VGVPLWKACGNLQPAPGGNRSRYAVEGRTISEVSLYSLLRYGCLNLLALPRRLPGCFSGRECPRLLHSFAARCTKEYPGRWQRRCVVNRKVQRRLVTAQPSSVDASERSLYVSRVVACCRIGSARYHGPMKPPELLDRPADIFRAAADRGAADANPTWTVGFPCISSSGAF